MTSINMEIDEFDIDEFEDDGSWYMKEPGLAPSFPCSKKDDKQYAYYRAVYEAQSDHFCPWEDFTTSVETVVNRKIKKDIKEKTGLFEEAYGKRKVDLTGPGFGYRWVNNKLHHLIAHGYVEKVFADDEYTLLGYKIASIEHYHKQQKIQRSKNTAKKVKKSVRNLPEAVQSYFFSKDVEHARAQGYTEGRSRKSREKLELVLCAVLGSISTLALVLSIGQLID